MQLPDVNVLLYAFREEMPQHEGASRWLNGVRQGNSAFAVSELTLSSFIRIVTNRRAFPVPSHLAGSFAFVDALLATPNAVVLRPGERHWAIFRALCIETNATDNRVPDAYLAALAIEHGCEFVTFDRGFGRYPGLRWSSPEP